MFFKILTLLHVFGLPWLILALAYDFRPVNLIYLSGVIAGMCAQRVRAR